MPFIINPYQVGSGAAPALWKPSDATGYTDEFWYEPFDAASMSLTGAALNQINDKSGNARHATATLTQRPNYSATGFNGGPGLQCTGGMRMLVSTTSKIISNSSTNGDTATNALSPIGTSDYPGCAASGLSLDSPHIMVGYWDTVNWFLRINGSAISNGAWTVAPTAPGIYWHAIDLIDSGAFGFGRICSDEGAAANTLLLFNRNGVDRGLNGACGGIGFGSAGAIPATADYEKTEAYLMWATGMQASLPGGHTYAGAAPTV